MSEKHLYIVERVEILQRRVRYQVEARSATLARHKVESNTEYPELEDDGLEILGEFYGPTRLQGTGIEDPEVVGETVPPPLPGVL